MTYQIAGTVPSPPDQRDYIFVPKFKPEELQQQGDLTSLVFQYEDQETIGSCVSNMLLSKCEIIMKQHSTSLDLSRLAHYNMTKAYSGRLGESGLYMRNALEVARRFGLAREEVWPYDVQKDNIDPPESVYQDASERVVNRYERINTDHYDSNKKVNHIISALQEGHVVGFAMTVTDSLRTLTGPWQNHQYELTNPSNHIGGHAMYIAGWDQTREKFIVVNSWGTDWGDQGICGLPYSIVDEPFFEAWIIREFNGLGIKEEPGVKLEYINKYRAHARLVPKEEEIGQTVNIWVAAVLDGHIFIKPPVTDRDYFIGSKTDFSGQTDNWTPFDSTNIPPVITDYRIEDDNPLRIISWRDLRPAKGATFLLAYGESDNVYESQLFTVGIVPDNL